MPDEQLAKMPVELMRTYHFYCDGDAEQRDWIEAFTTACRGGDGGGEDVSSSPEAAAALASENEARGGTAVAASPAVDGEAGPATKSAPQRGEAGRGGAKRNEKALV